MGIAIDFKERTKKATMQYYLVTFRDEESGRSMSVDFHCASGLPEEERRRLCLRAVAKEVADYREFSREEWFDEMDLDPLKNAKKYERAAKLADRLEKFLGSDEAVETFLHSQLKYAGDEENPQSTGSPSL